MNVNTNKLLIGGASLLVGGASLATSVGTLKLAKKLNGGKPVGLYGSTGHLMTNDKVEDKFCVVKDVAKQQAKDLAKLTAATAGVAGAGYLAGKTSVVQNFLAKAKSEAGNLLSKVSIEGKGNVKEMIKSTGAYQKINSLPTPVKAAALAGIGLLSVAIPVLSTKAISDAAAIEAKHEQGCVA